MFNEGDIALLERAGVFHRAEARRHGLSDRQIWTRAEAGIWVEVLPRVYRSTATAMTEDLWRRAALLWAGEDAVLSHHSAAAVWRLDGVDATRAPHVAVPIEHNPRSSLVAVHRSRVDPGDIVSIAGLRCTGGVRTIFDVAPVIDEVSLEAAIESARRRYGTSPAALQARLAVARRPPKVLTRVLRQLDSGSPTESVLEVRVARLLRAAGLPQPSASSPFESSESATASTSPGLRCVSRSNATAARFTNSSVTEHVGGRWVHRAGECCP